MDDIDRLASIAQQLAARLRDDEPEDNWQWFRTQVPDPEDWLRMTFVLAAAVPEDRTWRQLIAWTVPPPEPPEKAVRKPPDCGTTSGYRRHNKLGETACRECKAAEAARARRRRAKALPLGPVPTAH